MAEVTQAITNRRKASVRLVRKMLRFPVKSEKRMRIFAKLVQYEYGCWQHPEATHKETIHGFTDRVAYRAIERIKNQGGRHLAYEPCDLSHDLLIALVTADRPIKKLRGWLIGVAVRTVYNSLKRESPYIHAKTLLDSHPVEPADAIEPSRDVKHLRESLAGLSSQVQLIMALHMCGFSAPRIADELELSPAAVRQTLSRARRTIRAEMTARHLGQSPAAHSCR
jgi:RNA polymerase sigma factor (sigma-70 family)